MKAITLTQPWASLVAIGTKEWETRSWACHYRGLLAIHAAKGYPRWAQQFSTDEGLHNEALVLAGLDPAALPLGAVLCIARVTGCRKTVDVAPSLSRLEIELGDYSAGRFAFRLELVEIFPVPIPARGALGLWEWERAAQESV